MPIRPSLLRRLWKSVASSSVLVISPTDSLLQDSVRVLLPLETRIRNSLMNVEEQYNRASVFEESGEPDSACDAYGHSFSALLEARIAGLEDPRYDALFTSTFDGLFADLNKKLNGYYESPLVASAEELAQVDSLSFGIAAPADSAIALMRKDAFPIVADEPLVRNYLELFQKEPRRTFLQESFDRSAPFREMIRSYAKEKGFPEEMWLVPVVESGYKLKVHSTNAAIGLWQFMAPTAMGGMVFA
ncbi:MAG: transglycosylase SLT domain-containing protein [Nanoarchaeota archaeon]